jgi:hypothetical protein
MAMETAQAESAEVVAELSWKMTSMAWDDERPGLQVPGTLR